MDSSRTVLNGNASEESGQPNESAFFYSFGLDSLIALPEITLTGASCCRSKILSLIRIGSWVLIRWCSRDFSNRNGKSASGAKQTCSAHVQEVGQAARSRSATSTISLLTVPRRATVIATSNHRSI